MATEDQIAKAGELEKKMKLKVNDVLDKKAEYKSKIRHLRNTITDKKAEAREREREAGQSNRSAAQRMYKMKQSVDLLGEVSQLQKKLNDKLLEFKHFKRDTDLSIKEMQNKIRQLKA